MPSAHSRNHAVPRRLIAINARSGAASVGSNRSYSWSSTTCDKCFSKRTLPPNHSSKSSRLLTWSADPPMVTSEGSSGNTMVITPTRSSAATATLRRRSAPAARAPQSNAALAASSQKLRCNCRSPEGRSKRSLNG